MQKFFFKPADFGVLAVFISLSDIFTNISCLKLEFAIVPQTSYRKAVNMAFGAIKVSWIVALLSLILILIFAKELSSYFNEPKLNGYLFLIPIYVLITGFNDVLSYWFNRRKRFTQISKSKIIQTSSAELVKLGSGLMSINYIGLIAGRILGFFFSLCYFLSRLFKEDKHSFKFLNHRESNALIKENKRYLFFTTPSVFLGSLLNLVYLNLFLVHFGKEVVGIIGVSMTYISAGFGVISLSFSQVFYAEISEIRNREEILKIYLSFAKKLMLLAIVPLVLIYLIPGKLIIYLLGDQWEQLIHVARIMAIWLAVWFVSSSLSFIYIRLGRQREMMIFDLLHLVLMVGGFYAGYFFSPTLMGALWGFSISQVIYYLFAIFIAIYFIKKFKDV